MYKSTINAIDQTNKNEINNPQLIKNINRISFPFHLKCLNFRENIGNSEININDIPPIIGNKNAG